MPEIRANKRQYVAGVDIIIVDGESVAEPIIMKTDPDMKHMIVQPALTIDNNAAQSLMDDLWQAGFRPSEGSGSAGALKATQNHLKDMQKLVFDPVNKGKSDE